MLLVAIIEFCNEHPEWSAEHSITSGTISRDLGAVVTLTCMEGWIKVGPPLAATCELANSQEAKWKANGICGKRHLTISFLYKVASDLRHF